MRYALCVILLLTGCGSLHADYVQQDRDNYETLAPVVRRLLATSDTLPTEEEQDVEDRLQAWDAKTTSALASIAAEGSK